MNQPLPPSAVEGRHVAGPWQLTLSEWWCILGGVRATAERSNLALISAGVAFFGLMAVIPGIAGVTALLGLFGDPQTIERLIDSMGGLAPDAVVTTIRAQVLTLLEAQESALLAGTLFNIVLALWSALQGTRVMLMALTLVNRRAERPGMMRRILTAGAFTMSGIGLVLMTVAALGIVPVALAFLPLGSGTEVLLLVVRWPVLAAATIAITLALYRWGPRRRSPPWRWLWPGAIGAPLLWLLASTAFTFALREFPGFGATYGSLASAVALLLWLYITAFVFLLGGALNAELEFFAAGRPSEPVGKDEVIEPPTSVTGSKKEVAP